MPSSPDDYKKRKPAHKPKRARRTISTTNRKKGKAYPPEVTQAVEQLLRLPRLHMLAAVIKTVMRDRINDKELQMICKLYHAARIWKRMEESL
jgi:hypothetical protein